MQGASFAALLLLPGAQAGTLYDVEGKSHVVQRKDIELMKASALSIMPVGLIDLLPEEDAAGLIEYLASSREAPKKR